MTLALFNLEFRGLPHREATSANPAVAQAIIGVDTFLTQASKVLFGYVVEPEIDVRAAEGTGDFEVDLGFRIDAGKAQCAALAGKDFYANPQPEVVLKALGFLRVERTAEQEAALPDGWCDGLIELMLSLGGRRPEKIYLTGREVDIDVGHEERFVVNKATYELFKNRMVRAGIHALVQALADNQIAEIAVSDRKSGQTVFVLRPEHITAFMMNEPQEVLLVERVRTMALTLQAPVYRSSQAWFFDNGLQQIRASMCDKDFLSLIDSGIFDLRPGDVLVANVSVKTLHQRDRGLVSTYEIVSVLDLRKPDTDVLMPGI